MSTSTKKLAIVLPVISIILGMGSGIVTSPGDYLWYNNLTKPALSPPNWIFAPIWLVLYALIGIVFYKLWIHRNQKNIKFALYIFILHYIGNLIWSYIFFHQQQILWAGYDLVFLWISLGTIILLTIKIAAITKLLFPYLLWLSYALYLNYGIYLLNC